MNTTQQFFLQVLKDHMSKTATIPISGIEWKEIITYAYNHEVEGIVFFQCKDFLPQDIYSFFQKKFNNALFHHKNIEMEYRTIEKLFKNDDISVCVVKGLEIASFYPIPALRTMGDLDIIVSQADKEKAGKILETQGYHSDQKFPDFDWHYLKGNLHIELHHKLIYLETVTDAKQFVFFNRYEEFVRNGKLDTNFHFVFLIAHLRKHLMNSGAGFRMFMDIDAAIRYDQGLDWNWIEEKLEYLGMKYFSSICFALCENWFGTPFVIKTKELSEDFLEYAAQKIFRDGIFGDDNKQNHKNVAISAIIKGGKSRKGSRLLIIIKHIFPKYMNMRHLPQYSFLDGRPWLLPAAWVYRFVRYMAGKTTSASDFIKKLDVADSEIDAREEELKMWGLSKW